MKLLQTTVFAITYFTAVTAFAQSPVQWSFTSKKISDTKFEIHLTASIKSGWHIYASSQPEDAIALPTTVQFQKNPLIQFHGSLKEKGNLQKVKEEQLGIEAFQYSDKLNYSQVVELRNKGKASVNGSIEFQACTDEICLPPTTIRFVIALE